MKNKIKIICTLGPSSFNKKFLRFSKKKISLLRLNMSHLSIANLIKSIKFIKKYTQIPICIDTEGAQVRTKVKEKKFFKMNQTVTINSFGGLTSLYPESIYHQIKLNDILNIVLALKILRE